MTDVLRLQERGRDRTLILAQRPDGNAFLASQAPSHTVSVELDPEQVRELIEALEPMAAKPLTFGDRVAKLPIGTRFRPDGARPALMKLSENYFIRLNADQLEPYGPMVTLDFFDSDRKIVEIIK